MLATHDALGVDWEELDTPEKDVNGQISELSEGSTQKGNEQPLELSLSNVKHFYFVKAVEGYGRWFSLEILILDPASRRLILGAIEELVRVEIVGFVILTRLLHYIQIFTM